MPDYTVIEHGTDPNGRTILMTRYMRDWWANVVDVLGYEPTIVQGCFMARLGGGATASAGYHDQGGCLDLRVWDLTSDKIAPLISTLRRHGAAAWVRDAQRGGMDPHIHLVLGSDAPLASGASWQWAEYIEGNDGLATRGSDYHWRPRPLVTTPPAPKGFVMDKEAAARFDRLEDNQRKILDKLGKDAVIRARLTALVKAGRAEKRDLEELLELTKSDDA